MNRGISFSGISSGIDSATIIEQLIAIERRPIVLLENQQVQEEIKLGVLPGMGGSQRLTRAIGKAKAMDLILTGRNMDAEEAERAGLVSRVVPADALLDEANKVAATIAGMSLSAARMAKEAVDRSFETTLSEGLLYERRLFHSAFATDDQTEGMAAFTEKRAANFTHR